MRPMLNMVVRFISLVFIAIAIYSERLYATNMRSYEWWWVFYEHDESAHRTLKTIRPFYLSSVPVEGKAFYASLMPLVWWAYETPREYRWKSLIGFVQSVDYAHADGVRDYDFGIFPFLFFGTSPDERDRYLMVWPFGGSVKGKLGQDIIAAYLFPGFLLFFIFPPTFPPTLLTTAVLIASFIPLYVEYQSRDYQAWGILWPLVQRGRSNTRDDFRILPFYAHNYKYNSYDNYSFLFVINYNRTFLNDDEQRTFFLFPLFGRRWNLSGKVESATLLWPFFSWGFNRGTGSFELNFPWPFVQIQQSLNPRVYKRIFFPFYGVYRFEERETLFITPFYFSLKTEKKNFRSEYHIASLVFWYFTREYLDKPSRQYGSRWRYIKLWPLFQFESDDRGNVAFNMLSILPWRDPDGYEMMYQPFWTLFEYRRFHDGEQRMGFFLRLYYQRWNENFFVMKIPFLFTYESENGQLRELSFLLSMFSYGQFDDGFRFRFLWIPFTRGNPKKGNLRVARAPKTVSDYNEVASLSMRHRWNNNPSYDYDKMFCSGQFYISSRVF
ncbi:MAG: hypothetical protein N2316_04030 [Spirochaetes bacterium]|nr:hypothetical protein [Spirochaetota bacterium]